MYRFLRCFLCLLVVCCLIINLSPIKADATSAGAAAGIAGAAGVTVSAPVAIAAGLIALGIMAGTNDDFRRVVSNAVDSLGEWVKDGTVELLQTVDELGKKSYYAEGNMIDSLKNWVHDSGTVSELMTNSFYDTGEYYKTVWSDIPFCRVVFTCSEKDTWFEGTYTREPGTIYKGHQYGQKYSEQKITANSFGCPYNGYYFSVSYGSGSIPESYSSRINLGDFSYDQLTKYNYGNSSWSGAARFIAAEVPLSFTTVENLSLGSIPDASCSFIDGTSAREWSVDYTNRGLYVDPVGDGDGNDEDGKWYWPLVLAPGIESLTQTDQWTGTTADEFDDYETEEEYDVVGTPVVPFGSGVQLKPVTVPGAGDNTDVESGTTDGTADYTSWFDKIAGFLHNIWDSIKELPNKFADWFEAIIEGISALPGKFATWFETIIEGIQAISDVLSGWFTDVLEWLASIWDAICSIPDLILEGIRAIFVPSDDFVTTKVEALRDRFSWIDPILGYGDFIKSQLINPEPPVLYVHLGNAEGSYNYGGTVKFLELTWYERYKSQGDAIISGFLWALFAWRMYVKLPGIINGVAGDVGHISYGESAWQKADGRKERKEKGGKNK